MKTLRSEEEIIANWTNDLDKHHVPDIKDLSKAYDQVNYLGVIPATEAAELVNKHRWALLPIDDEVTKYAFLNKSSGYACQALVF
ncbi:MAG: hypothetical protein ACI936_002505 [Paraglaciecola sp.]|jgi:hypothetical protein